MTFYVPNFLTCYDIKGLDVEDALKKLKKISKLEVIWTNQFKKDYKAAIKRHLEINLLNDVIRKLSNLEPLEDKYKDHTFFGNFHSFKECHIKPDWLLIYKIDNNKLILTLTRTGSHSDLFGKQFPF